MYARGNFAILQILLLNVDDYARLFTNNCCLYDDYGKECVLLIFTLLPLVEQRLLCHAKDDGMG